MLSVNEIINLDNDQLIDLIIKKYDKLKGPNDNMLKNNHSLLSVIKYIVKRLKNRLNNDSFNGVKGLIDFCKEFNNIIALAYDTIDASFCCNKYETLIKHGYKPEEAIAIMMLNGLTNGRYYPADAIARLLCMDYKIVCALDIKSRGLFLKNNVSCNESERIKA